MIAIADTNSRITVSHFAKVLCLVYVVLNGELDELIKRSSGVVSVHLVVAIIIRPNNGKVLSP